MYSISRALVLLSATFVFLLALPAGKAQARTVTTPYYDGETYADYAAIPQALRQSLRRSGFIEAYINQTVGFVRRYGEDKNTFTRADMQSLQEKEIKSARNRQFTSLIRHDENFDAVVTESEIRHSLKSMDSRRTDDWIDRQARTQMKHDIDGNGEITLREMSTLDEKLRAQASKRSQDKYESYLSLDPNGDGVLTVAELDMLARKAFATIDADGDGILTDDDRRMIANMEKNIYSSPAGCSLPPVPEDVQLISIGAYEGDALSTVTAAGQDNVTTTISVEIAEDAKPMYLLLSSYDPIIWRFTGNTAAVRRLALSSLHRNEKGFSGSGATGLPKDRVSFLKYKCLPYYHNPMEKKGRQAKTAIEKLAGRETDWFDGSYSYNRLFIGSAKIDFAKTETKMSAPKGYAPEVWPTLLRFSPGGVVEIDPESVVAHDKVEKYEVLPQEAGLAKLVHDGALQIEQSRSNTQMLIVGEDTIVINSGNGGGRDMIDGGEGHDTIITNGQGNIRVRRASPGLMLSGTYRIVKDIPRYPTGLAGAHSVTFIVSKGVKKPAGRAGHSCVIDENTGETQGHGPLCRR